MPIPASRPFEVPAVVPVPKPVYNLKDLANQLKGVLTAELQGLLGDVQADLAALSAEIAPVLVSAVATGDKALTKELVAQLEGIAEIHKIKANARAWAVIRSVTNVALGALSIGFSAVTKLIPA